MTLSDQHNQAVAALLASAFKLLLLDDEAAGRGADKAIRYLAAHPILNFDPTETRALSETAQDGTFYVTDGVHCTCKARGTWCKHRIGHRFKLAELALTDPAALVRLIVEQAVPPVEASDVAAVACAEAAIRGVIAAPFDLADDALYADLVAGAPLAPRPTVVLSEADREIDELYA
jgi:hypothetical protein